MQKESSDIRITKQVFKYIAIIIAVIFLILFIFSSFFSVDEGARGVVLRNGAFIRIAEPGLGWKMPFVDDVIEISIKSYARSYPKITSYSKDQQPANLHVSVTYRVPATEKEIKALYSTYTTVEGLAVNLIDRAVSTQAENVFGHYTAISAVQERVKFGHDLTIAIKSAIIGPVVIESVQLENIDFSDAYEHSVEARMKAEVEVQTQKQTLDKEKISAEIAVTQAQGRADSELAKATAEAKAIRLRGEAEAYAIEARAKALAQNLNLTELIKAEKWDGKLPTTMVPGGTVPFMNVHPNK